VFNRRPHFFFKCFDEHFSSCIVQVAKVQAVGEMFFLKFSRIDELKDNSIYKNWLKNFC